MTDNADEVGAGQSDNADNAEHEALVQAVLAAGETGEQKAADIAHGRKKPKFDADELRSRLRLYDRTPFLSVLEHWLHNSPSVGDIQALAKRSPDKYISALSQLAKIAGFTEKTEHAVDLNINISRMSDSQLEDELRKHGIVIDASFQQVLSPPASAGTGTGTDNNDFSHAEGPASVAPGKALPPALLHKKAD